MLIRDRVTVITGGANGIGAAMSRRFSVEGAAHVVVTDIDGDAAQRLADEIGGEGVALDVTDEAATRRLVADVERTHGRIDLFCANAGIGPMGGLEMDDASWDLVWQVNAFSHVIAARAVVPGMLERGEGYFLSTVSAAGLLTNIGAAAYSVSKHAALALAEWLAVTYGDQGLRVSALCPQFVATDLLDQLAGGDIDDTYIRSVTISADEVAESVIEGLADERFLILPHPEVARFFQNKAEDHDRWLEGMRNLQRSWLPNPPAPPLLFPVSHGGGQPRS